MSILNNTDLTAIILMKDEELHIRRCLDSLNDVASEIIIVDSGSTDRSVEIAKDYSKVRLYLNPWINYANQFNWALDNTEITSKWVLRIDCDEYLTDELRTNLKYSLSNCSQDTLGFVVNRLMYFRGSPLKNGGMYPIEHLRIWRHGYGRCEERWMDEHIVLEVNGRVDRINGDLVDENLNGISWWINKHNAYATREAIDAIISDNCRLWGLNDTESELSAFKGKQADDKRRYKNFYGNLPLFWRVWFLYFYRLVIKAAFLDGRNGVLWVTLQTLFYRYLVDVKISEIYDRCGNDYNKIKAYVKAEWGYNI